MPWNLENWRVFFSLDDTLGTIADYSFSFKLNMLRVKVTHAFQGAVPAYDIVYDYSKGSAFYFDNATSTCHAISSPQANLTHVVEKFLSKFEDQSTKGRNMRLYTANIREKDNSANYYFYGDFKGNIFNPSKFQVNFLSGSGLSGEILDEIDEDQEFTIEDFTYPECEGVEQTRLEMASPMSLLINPITLTDLVKISE
eukprot:CAMPEP_0205805492 /NCGR_PEP_ID=MMETSP0205-20121125/8739_1 /ASSEMBLY_ACC=CAM_ASM_000278 /TAXON_ID=36767 /ORGANISM="Euplotes focardii, Strain TN1" /LENGTH=197 /DNA_ID=CAMNT_0053076811 /DNA_START=117 /DNA_END=710 /DNA_ORIENTATION=-